MSEPTSRCVIRQPIEGGLEVTTDEALVLDISDLVAFLLSEGPKRIDNYTSDDVHHDDHQEYIGWVIEDESTYLVFLNGWVIWAIFVTCQVPTHSGIRFECPIKRKQEAKQSTTTPILLIIIWKESVTYQSIHVHEYYKQYQCEQ